MFVAETAEVRTDVDSGGAFAAFDGLAYPVYEPGNEVAVGIEHTQPLSHAAKVTRRKAEPAAGLPFTGVQAGERNFVKQRKIFGNC